MKRIFLILLTLVYTSAVSGATFHLHFCGDHLQIISFAGMGHDKCCCAEETPKKENCCTDKVVTVKVNEKHSGCESHVVPLVSVKELPSLYDACIPALTTSLVTFSYVDHPPPPNDHAQPSLLIMNSTLRI